ncbi:hypothetical protein MLD38_014760 [Melastoma candidum]|uniref:Uncharacterized protein n=1 Tax=Melastoma candidum TaxID=119954 RepID=A0ACB9RI13_9MYRT|nr:hypothetical protein MLD38_014760 [Melastoma candidum]
MSSRHVFWNGHEPSPGQYYFEDRYDLVHVFKSTSGACAAFLANYDTQYSVTVNFGNGRYNLPPWSISVLHDCKTDVFNTARTAATGCRHGQMTSVVWAMPWESYKEETASAFSSGTFTKDGLVEQVDMTSGKTDCLCITISSNKAFLKNGKYPVLTVMSAYGTMENPRLTFTRQVKLKAGVNQLSLLSVSSGLANVGVHLERWNVGVLGPVTLKGLNSGTWDMSKWMWSYKVGLKGESQELYTISGSSSARWAGGSWLAKKQPLTWYKTYFSAPWGNDPLALYMSSMGKGQIWINGRNVGRHWPPHTQPGVAAPGAATRDSSKRTSVGAIVDNLLRDGITSRGRG